VLAPVLGDLPSVDLAGKFDVGHQHVGNAPPAPCQRFFSVGGVDHLVTFVRQGLDGEFANEGIVLDQALEEENLTLRINGPFLFELKATAAEYKAGIVARSRRAGSSCTKAGLTSASPRPARICLPSRN